VLAVLLSTESSGLAGFGLAALVLSAGRALALDSTRRRTVLIPAASAWLAVWFSPGVLPLVCALLVEATARMNRAQWIRTAVIAAIACHITPRGVSIWADALEFVRWSPQPAPSGPAAFALFASVATALVVLRIEWKYRSPGPALAPLLLFVCAASGQTAFLWAGALWTIPLWQVAKEGIQRAGFNLRWWMQTSLLLCCGLLVFADGASSLPRWFSLAMTEAVVKPTLTREALPATGPVYVNPTGLPLARFGGPLPEGALPAGDPVLAREPSLWRAKDREVRYRAVWLLGDKSGYAPLARHLGESPDWRLAAVDAAGALFVREPRAAEFATEPARQMAREMWGGANRSGFLSACALSCLAANAIPEAAELANAAVRDSDRSAPAAATRARVLVSAADIRQALADSERATAIDPSLAFAWEVRAETLLHTGRTDDAYAAAVRAADLAPGDAGTLWLAARSANAARAFQSEAEILEKLVALTRGRGGDPGFYLLYLGQAYAKQGLVRPALRAFELAAAAPGLSPQQRKELDEEIARVRSHPDAL
jgi:tetratricopeptide (TPR) repeat protein